ncbi:MAG: TetR/AcrR family transcriptional regulator [Lachnospiraceae bacterium]|nr:TetR/AcrR family transcriptional regulator [Lachnospiraceae bacterium]
MKREEKNALSRQRILDAAMEEFSGKGYEGASLNTVCSVKGISKGIIYHYFKDKNELYLLCVEECFREVTAYLQEHTASSDGPAGKRLQDYFNARLRFFADHPLCLGIFAEAVFNPPAGLKAGIAARKQDFDRLNISVLTKLLESEPLREGLTVSSIVEDFRMYMDIFNMRFQADVRDGRPMEELLKEHEERCHRQLDIMLYGVLGERNA